MAGAAPDHGARLGAKTRYRQADARCTFSAQTDAVHFSLGFDAPQWAVTPGQSAVLYDGDVCLGGGIIEQAATAASIATDIATSTTSAA